MSDELDDARCLADIEVELREVIKQLEDVLGLWGKRYDRRAVRVAFATVIKKLEMIMEGMEG